MDVLFLSVCLKLLQRQTYGPANGSLCCMPLYIKSRTAVCVSMVIIVQMVLSSVLCVGFLWLICCFCLYVCLYGGSMCVHTSVPQQWTGCCHTPAVANEREGEKGEDDRLIILWNAHRFPILKSSSAQDRPSFVSLTYCVVNRSWGHTSADTYLKCTA